jgi:hypothetical protein
MITAAVDAGILKGLHMTRFLHNSQQTPVPALVRAQATGIHFTYIPADLAAARFLHGPVDCARQVPRPTITQHVKRETLSGDGADTWEEAKGVDQGLDGGGIGQGSCRG